MQSFFIALQFLTCLPIPAVDWNEKAVSRSLKYYPLVGLVIGLFLLGTSWLSSHTDPMLQAALILGAWAIITGGLHLDGLTDCADAWVGGLGERERTLSIMKDPYCGPMGVIALVILLLIQYSAIIALVGNEQLMVLLYIPIIARLLPSLFFMTTTYARKEGLGSSFTENSQRKPLILIIVACSILIVLLNGAIGILLLVTALIVFFVIRANTIKRIGGFTGDVLGAAIVIFEASALAVIALFI